MPRKRLQYIENGLYHVTARANNREWFYIPMEELWQVFLEQLQEISIQYHSHITAFVLMSNHYHLLIETPDANLGLAMNYLQREVSRSVGAISGRINHIFGGSYKGSLIKNAFYQYNVYRYVYQNPVAGGLCNQVEDYPYSTIQFLLRGKFPIAISDLSSMPGSGIPETMKERVLWLNESLTEEQRTLIQKCLRRSEFKFPKKYQMRELISSLKHDAAGVKR